MYTQKEPHLLHIEWVLSSRRDTGHFLLWSLLGISACRKGGNTENKWAGEVPEGCLLFLASVLHELIGKENSLPMLPWSIDWTI